MSFELGFKSHYEILGISNEKATTEEIKEKYKALVLEVHPDKNLEEAIPAPYKNTEITFQAVFQAYKVLRDPSQRSAYDQGLYDRRYRLPGVVNETVYIDELEKIEDGWVYPCRCGDEYFVPSDDLDLEIGLSLIVNCSNCSLLLRVIPA
ncbi:DnaJ sub C member 24 [Entomophthora muscae]|uniref:DnaJ sub C member 24 n=1 Tax=Entomophthora muscae TaxID=34485 RepID=A0ACC2RVV8_9FUNG|nr:DnaJ sub C member 24 [Entomophthora muscae]